MNETLMDLSDQEFRQISSLVYEKFGINLTDKKRALIRGRLQKQIKSRGFESFQEYYQFVVNDRTGEGLLELVDRLSTNHTYFFRENEHFSFLENSVLPHLRGDDLRIWSAGCSSGEEPYTLAMVLSRFFQWKKGTAGPCILASDISLSVLESARRGIYPEERLRITPSDYKREYFKSCGDGQYQVDEALRKMVLFKRLNLMNDSYPFRNQFDCIFCRNVMIYFDEETRRQLVSRMIRHLKPNGYLFIGHSESLGRKIGDLKYEKPAVYRKEPV